MGGGGENRNKHHRAHIEERLSEAFRSRRLELRLRQGDVAARIGVTRQALCQWEQGTSWPITFSRWQRWASAVSMDLTIEATPKGARPSAPDKR